MIDQPDDDDSLRNAIALLQADVPVVPGLVGRVTSRRRHLQRRRRVYGSTLAVLAGVAVIQYALSDTPAAKQGAALALGTAGDTLTFTITAPASQEVALVGDFTDWRTDSIRLSAQDDGTWAVTVRLPPGRYRYAYVVDDNEWRADPGAMLVPDDFGRPTSVVVVGEGTLP